MREMMKHPEFRVGMHDMLSVAPGIAAWGLMTGVAMMKSGLSLTEVLMMGTLVFAGSSQLAALPLIVAGAPMWVVLATAFCVNLRFIVFSAHLRPYVMHHPTWRRMLNGYLMADLNYVMFIKHCAHPASDPSAVRAQDAYWMGNCLTGWLSWTIPSLAGIALANSIPVSWGLGFAGILALLGILSSLATTQLRAVSAAVSGAAAVATFALPLKLNILVAISAALVVCLTLEKSKQARSASVKSVKTGGDLR